MHGQFPLAKFWCKLLTSCQVLFPTSHRDVPYRDEFIQSVGVFSFFLMCESIATQFLILDTFVPRENSCGERFSFVEDKKSSFIRRLANFGIVSSFSSTGKKHKFRAYPSNPKIGELSEALGSAFSLFEEQEQALWAYCHFHSFFIFQKTLFELKNKQ